MKHCGAERESCHRDFTVFTPDLDFTTLLAITGAKGPSVIQRR